MSEPSSPARAEEPARDPGNTPPPASGNAPPRTPASAPPAGGGQAPRHQAQAPNQTWKIVALAVALVVLAVLLFILFSAPAVEETSAPEDEEAEFVEEEEAAQPAPAPPPPAVESPAPSAPSSSSGSDAPALPPLNVLSVGYSTTPALRVVALRIGGALPYFLHEGDTVGAIKIVAILQDRIQISHKSKTYEIRVGADGKPVGEPKLVR